MLPRLRAAISHASFAPTLRSLRNLLVFRGVTVGKKIHFLSVGTIHVSLSDRRGQALLQRNGVFQPVNVWLWRRLARTLAPQLVLDIGTNYGDVLLSSRYPPQARILAFEANPNLLPLLRTSIAAHRDGDRIQVQQCLVGDQDGGMHGFTVDNRWSGTSSALGTITNVPPGLKGDGPEDVTEVEVPCRTIDAILAGGAEAAGRDLLFKIDVEGYEGRVLGGMRHSLAAARRHAGLIEFDPLRLTRAGTDPAEVFALLTATGTVWRLDRTGRPCRVMAAGDIDDTTDLIAVSDPALLTGVRVPAILR